jgi:hypothetical protein
MTGDVRMWDGKDWEEYVMQLLRLRYAPGDLVEIPDRDSGDAGLEAFASDGRAYQCYAPQEPLRVDDRYGKQRDKITQDLSKFRDAAKVAPLLGATVIRRWILVTPSLDSRRLVAHCASKTAEIRAAGLTYVDADFEVRAITDDTFATERASLLAAGIQELDLGTTTPQLELQLEFVAANGSHAANLDRKLSAVPAFADQERREHYARELVGAYLEGSDGRQRLRDDFPDLARPLDKLIGGFRRLLVLRYGLAPATPDRLVSAIAEDLMAQVQTCLPALRVADAQLIAYAAIAEWLMECHLDFGAAS